MKGTKNINLENTCSSYSTLSKIRETFTATKVRSCRSNVKSVLLHGCKTSKVTRKITEDLQTLIKMFMSFWPNAVSNE